jgi:hypothetical protein
MKTKPISKVALALLISGLLLVSGVPLIARYIPIPDLYKGLLTGVGLALEFLAIVKIDKDKKTCRHAA